MSQLDTPVAFLVFNRPDTTARVFEAIRQVRPATLLIVADGPRASRPAEAERCARVREICAAVDWPCEVLRNYADKNLGCRGRVSSGLDWVFETVEQAIIVEDDCLPHSSFFPYCQELLNRYRDDERVMMIRGSQFLPAAPRSSSSYYFSQFPHIWGWASWRRAWRHYDVDMQRWSDFRNGRWLTDMFGPGPLSRYWRDIFDRVASGKIDTWDYQFFFACFSQSGLAIAPSVNLVSNIGFGDEATHTFGTSQIENLPAFAMPLPLVHPPFVIRDRAMDEMTARILFRKESLPIRLLAAAKGAARNLVGAQRYTMLKQLMGRRAPAATGTDVLADRSEDETTSHAGKATPA